jgi:hypothetical protein
LLDGKADLDKKRNGDEEYETVRADIKYPFDDFEVIIRPTLIYFPSQISSTQSSGRIQLTVNSRDRPVPRKRTTGGEERDLSGYEACNNIHEYGVN